MANASGAAINGFIPADFEHKASGVHYRISEEAGRVWMSYERDSASPDFALSGSLELRYFIGSGRRGRTYLFQRQGYWFEAPINWYAKQQVWDMAPNHLADREMPLTMPVDRGCLHCHASGVAKSLPEARNRYAGEPFAQGGITCEACHGDATAHLATEGRNPMPDIKVLEPVRRDSICLNCHLEGEAAVDRAGQESNEFVPGDSLFDHISVLCLQERSRIGRQGDFAVGSAFAQRVQEEIRRQDDMHHLPRSPRLTAPIRKSGFLSKALPSMP